MTSRFLPGISVVLVAYNEAVQLSVWLEKLSWVNEIVVIDSGSTDKTSEIALQHTKQVFRRSNKLNFDINKNFGFSKANYEWILSLDADEFLTDELINEIKAVISDSICSYAGFFIPFRTYVLGKEIPLHSQHMRLFRNGKAKFAEHTVHQQLELVGVAGKLQGYILHYTDASIFERVQKSNMYSECMAAYWFEQKKTFHIWEMLLQPLILFIKRYFIAKEYRHGILGFVNAVNTSYSMFLRYAKLWSAYELGSFPSPSDDFPAAQNLEQGGTNGTDSFSCR